VSRRGSQGGKKKKKTLLFGVRVGLGSTRPEDIRLWGKSRQFSDRPPRFEAPGPFYDYEAACSCSRVSVSIRETGDPKLKYYDRTPNYGYVTPRKLGLSTPAELDNDIYISLIHEKSFCRIPPTTPQPSECRKLLPQLLAVPAGRPADCSSS
jgi:hypothetical protein